MNSLLLTAMEKTAQTIVIQDNNGRDTLAIWCAIMLIVFMLYIAAMLVHDIRREEKLERLRKADEKKKEEEFIDDIDI